MEKTNMEQLLRLIADMEAFSKANDFITREIEALEEENVSEESLDLLYAAQAEPVQVPIKEEKKDRR
ncbi:MAG: hypothetical protein IJV76_01295 [Clostridia bacterium]|nr:hypothetical protein [Clostridia bacterium]